MVRFAPDRRGSGRSVARGRGSRGRGGRGGRDGLHRRQDAKEAVPRGHMESLEKEKEKMRILAARNFEYKKTLKEMGMTSEVADENDRKIREFKEKYRNRWKDFRAAKDNRQSNGEPTAGDAKVDSTASSSKPNRYTQTIRQLEQQREAAAAAKAERAAAIAAAESRRRERWNALSKRTKKGQPVMASMVDSLLAKVKASVGAY